MPDTVTIPKEEYKRLLEEIGILRNKELMAQVNESEAAMKNGVKPWKLRV